MILLDTNVLSALMLTRPNLRVVQWLDRQDSADIWTTSITVFEVRYGLARIQDIVRAAHLTRLFAALIDDDLQGRVADFDSPAAVAAAELAARRDGEGQTVDFRDTQIAGIAIARHATIATRNLRHFGDCGQAVINPWGDGG